jgi:hypothetical protein
VVILNKYKQLLKPAVCQQGIREKKSKKWSIEMRPAAGPKWLCGLQ